MTYCYVITNIGNEPLTSIRLTDVGATEKTMTLSSGSLATLLPGESAKLWVERVNNAYLASSATATATPSSGSTCRHHGHRTDHRAKGLPGYLAFRRWWWRRWGSNPRPPRCKRGALAS